MAFLFFPCLCKSCLPNFVLSVLFWPSVHNVLIISFAVTKLGVCEVCDNSELFFPRPSAASFPVIPICEGMYYGMLFASTVLIFIIYINYNIINPTSEP